MIVMIFDLGKKNFNNILKPGMVWHRPIILAERQRWKSHYQETDHHSNLCPLPLGFLNLSHLKVLSCPLRC